MFGTVNFFWSPPHARTRASTAKGAAAGNRADALFFTHCCYANILWASRLHRLRRRAKLRLDDDLDARQRRAARVL